MGTRGPKPISSQKLHALASELYWDFRHLAEGYSRSRFDRERYGRLKENVERTHLNHVDIATFTQKEEEIRSARLSESEKEERIRRLERDTMWAAYKPGIEDAYSASMTEFHVAGDPEVLNALLRAKTAEQVAKRCKSAFSVSFMDVFDPSEGKIVGQISYKVSTGRFRVGAD
jgi:hypothetical protein